MYNTIRKYCDVNLKALVNGIVLLSSDKKNVKGKKQEG